MVARANAAHASTSKRALGPLSGLPCSCESNLASGSAALLDGISELVQQLAASFIAFASQFGAQHVRQPQHR